MLGSSVTKWWSKAEGKEKRDMVINEIRLNEDFCRESSNGNRDNGLIGMMPCRNPSHGMTSGTWHHFGSAFSSDQCTISCPPGQSWYNGERKKITLVRYAMAGRPRSMS